jgi:hypothetical protein
MTRPTTEEFRIEVPGKFRKGTAYLDLETVKVSTYNASRNRGLNSDFIMQNGESLKNRWSIAMYGVALDGGIVLSDNGLNEPANIQGLGNILTGWNGGAASGGFMSGPINEVAYAATREFDEMVAKGRFTNARRAHELEPFFPAVPGADKVAWRNLGGKIPDHISRYRSLDTRSAMVPHHISRGSYELVTVHLLRDVVQLIMWDGMPDWKCWGWCERVMNDFEFAEKQVFGDEQERNGN